MRIRLISALGAMPLLVAPALADCIGDINEILSRSLTSGPFHVVSTGTINGEAVSATGDIALPGAMHMVSVQGSQTTEMIMVDGRAWTKAGDTWTELPADAASQIAASATEANATVAENLGSAQCLGTELLDGKSYDAYAYDFTLSGITTSTKVYADDKGLPVKVMTTMSSGSQKTETEAIITFDQSIAISPPM